MGVWPDLYDLKNRSHTNNGIIVQKTNLEEYKYDLFGTKLPKKSEAWDYSQIT
jgi:hypothetical protein